MQFATAGSQAPDLTAAVAEIASRLREQWGTIEGPADLACVFVSHHHRPHLATLAEQLQAAFPCRTLIGSVAETVIVDNQEWESGPALAVWVSRLPEYDLRPFRMEFEATPDGVVCTGVPEDLADDAARVRALLVLGEPYTCVPQVVLDRFADELPGVPIVGGMASGGAATGENSLFFGSERIPGGAVAVALLDGPPIRTVVSQGCRPVGEPFVATNVDKSIVLELGGKPALQKVQEVYQAASPADRQLFEHGLQLGVAISEYRDSFHQGDFLVASVYAADRSTGAIAAGLQLRRGQTVQFHVRDAASADEDLRQLLERLKLEPSTPVAGALLFSCNGRGTRLFPQPHHDAALIQDVLGHVPVAGMFAAGEIGPVGPQNFLHGFTASAAFFGG